MERGRVASHARDEVAAAGTQSLHDRCAGIVGVGHEIERFPESEAVQKIAALDWVSLEIALSQLRIEQARREEKK